MPKDLDWGDYERSGMAATDVAPEEPDLETPEGVQALFKQRLERWLDQQPDAVFTGYSLDGGWRVQLAGIGEIELQIKTVI